MMMMISTIMMMSDDRDNDSVNDDRDNDDDNYDDANEYDDDDDYRFPNKWCINTR
jgi:hypothetical protein